MNTKMIEISDLEKSKTHGFGERIITNTDLGHLKSRLDEMPGDMLDFAIAFARAVVKLYSEDERGHND